MADDETYSISELLDAARAKGAGHDAFTFAVDRASDLATSAGVGDWKTPILKNPDAASNAPGAGGKADAPPALPPINPVEALRQLAAAVSEAEQTLNQQNLVVATGTMDVELNVDVGGVLGAHAKLSLKIEPKPYV